MVERRDRNKSTRDNDNKLVLTTTTTTKTVRIIVKMTVFFFGVGVVVAIAKDINWHYWRRGDSESLIGIDTLKQLFFKYDYLPCNAL